MKKSNIIMLVSNFVMLLLLLNFAVSTTAMLIFIGAILFLGVFLLPAFGLIFMFSKYNRLKTTYQKLFGFFLLIQQQLKRVDEMKITNLQVVNLKQRIRILRKTMDTQKKRKRNA